MELKKLKEAMEAEEHEISLPEKLHKLERNQKFMDFVSAHAQRGGDTENLSSVYYFVENGVLDLSVHWVEREQEYEDDAESIGGDFAHIKVRDGDSGFQWLMSILEPLSNGIDPHKQEPPRKPKYRGLRPPEPGSYAYEIERGDYEHDRRRDERGMKF